MHNSGIRKGNKKAHVARCYATGGRVPEDISEAPLPMEEGTFDYGMEAEGGLARGRMDRASKKSAPVNVNIIVNSGKSPQPDAPMPPPPMPPMPPMGAGGPPPPPGGLGGLPPMPPAAGGPPIMRKDGGRVNKAGGPGVETAVKIGKGLAAAASPVTYGAALHKGIKGMKDPAGTANDFLKHVSKSRAERATGGRVEGGAGGGLGRLEKAKDAK